MNLETLLHDEIEREKEYLAEQDVGSDEYSACFKRLTILEEKLFDLEKLKSDNQVKGKQLELESRRLLFETTTKDTQLADEKRDRKIKNVLEGVKIGTGVLVPLIGLVWITATEKEVTFTGALKGYASLFVPKKLL